MKKKPEILDAQVVASSRLFNVEQIQLRFSNGNERTYERLKGGGRQSVLIVPVLNDDTLLLIREYAAGTDRYELGFPKGLVELNEDLLEAANRELQEEVGFAANNMQVMRKVSAAPGYHRSQMSLVLAQELHESQLDGDEPEEIEVVPWSIQAIDELLAQPDFTEARSIAALFLALRQLNRMKEIV